MILLPFAATIIVLQASWMPPDAAEPKSATPRFFTEPTRCAHSIETLTKELSKRGAVSGVATCQTFDVSQEYWDNVRKFEQANPLPAPRLDAGPAL